MGWPGTGAPLPGAGAPFTGALPAGVASSTVVPKPEFREARIESDSDVTIKSTAEIVVALESSVAEPRGPKVVCDPMPPNAPARSAAFPLCSNTTIIRKMHTTIWISKHKIYIVVLSV